MTSTGPIIAVDLHLAGGLHAVEAITSTGDTVLWIAVRTDAPTSYGCACAQHAPHEQAGALPPIYAARLERLTRRCGGVRADGGRCRAEVPIPGQRCHWHRAGAR